ncbi:DUF2157 domain-containing protein [Caenimonas sp. SL110]|uniref:DUF2157 domain-containing protein n=1 Tax=Caenimonas sp. SL110 TaxID=1450524 RepID=UPI0006541A67|nr:DUF2157 domain-containing protein [Caenimonas sp. SL110]
MSARLSLYELAGLHALDPAGAQLLVDEAGLNQEPAALQRMLWPVIAVIAAALVGLGVILWLAANWDTMGRTTRFALLQGVIAVMCIAAAMRANLRAPLGLLALICIGGLFAYFGQTYQTGADTWQLFAMWAVLALPLCLGARSDVLWAPWALVAMTAISLWVFAHTSHRWRVEPQDLTIYLVAWGASGVVVAALSAAFARITGAGEWAMRTAVTLAVIGITATALGGLFFREVAPHYPLALAVLFLAAALLAQKRFFDIFALSALALALDTLVITGLARWLFTGGSNDLVGRLMLIGLAACGILAGSVSLIMRLAKRHAVQGTEVAQ